MEMTIDIRAKNHILEFAVKYEYHLNGKHYPETRLTPEEFPEMVINNYTIYISGKWRYCPEWLETLIEDEYLNQFIKDAYDREASAKYEAAVHRAEMREDK